MDMCKWSLGKAGLGFRMKKPFRSGRGRVVRNQVRINLSVGFTLTCPLGISDVIPDSSFPYNVDEIEFFERALPLQLGPQPPFL